MIETTKAVHCLQIQILRLTGLRGLRQSGDVSSVPLYTASKSWPMFKLDVTRLDQQFPTGDGTCPSNLAF